MNVSSIRAEMARSGMNTSDLADFLGVSYGAANNRLIGTTKFAADEIIALADHFDVSIDYLCCRGESNGS